MSQQLMLSTYHGHAPLSCLLLSHGADPNRLNDRGQSPLAGAVFKNEQEIVDILLEAGADVDLGRPSAWEAVELFKKTDEYGCCRTGWSEHHAMDGGTRHWRVGSIKVWACALDLDTTKAYPKASTWFCLCQPFQFVNTADSIIKTLSQTQVARGKGHEQNA